MLNSVELGCASIAISSLGSVDEISARMSNLDCIPLILNSPDELIFEFSISKQQVAK